MVMRVLGCFVLALMSTGPLLAAQRPGGEDSPVRSRVERQVKEMRRQMVEGRVFRSHVRVTVRLQNGNRIRGIVKDGVLVERVEGPRFVAAERDEEGAGVRLYYYNGKRSFVFLPFRDIKDYRINRRITALELAQIERDSRHRESEDARKREAAAAIGVVEDARNRLARPAPHAETSRGTSSADPVGTTVKPAAGAGAGTAGTGRGGGLHDLYALLQKYPPAAGWSAARRDEIKRRLAVIGARPSAVELEFVKRFGDWQRACVEFGVKPQQDPQPEEPGAERIERRRSRRR